ncbi:xanthine dehydrogenase family protein subunit M [Acidiplasma sp.]|uniref:xanthine dehydrogenase family protein subunit M n=1 Tax=Acidiplasma sp. TaxID=1872114 RepID=UPI0031660E76
MYPDKFEYFAPEDIESLEKLLDKFQDDAKILAGGQSLIPLLKLRFTSIPNIIDIANIKELNFIDGSDGLKIGPMVRTAEVARNRLIKQKCNLLSDAASKIADPQVRNMGTIGGDVCEADPRNDMPAVMLALNAEFEITGSSGIRTVKATDFFKDAYTTDVRPNEILTKIIIGDYSKYYGKYFKFTTLSSDFPVFAIAVNMSVGNDKTINDVGIGLTNLNTTAVKAVDVEEFLKGKKPDDNTLESAFKKLESYIDIEDDVNGTKDHKMEILNEMFKNGIKEVYGVLNDGKH